MGRNDGSVALAHDLQGRRVAGGLWAFTYVSWVHWPWRSLAVAEEFTAYRRQGMLLAIGMVLLAGAGFVLGQACRLAYAPAG